LTLVDELLAELGDPGLEQIGGMLGTDPATARTILQETAGTIVAGLARSAEHPEGAEALRTALDDHTDADPFNGDVASLTRDGQNILAHVLGGQGAEHAADELARFAGVGSTALMKVLPLLAPMIMSLLAGQADRRDLEPEELADFLRRERAALPLGLRERLVLILADIFGDPGGLMDPQAARGAQSPDW